MKKKIKYLPVPVNKRLLRKEKELNNEKPC